MRQWQTKQIVRNAESQTRFNDHPENILTLLLTQKSRKDCNCFEMAAESGWSANSYGIYWTAGVRIERGQLGYLNSQTCARMRKNIRRMRYQREHMLHESKNWCRLLQLHCVGQWDLRMHTSLSGTGRLFCRLVYYAVFCFILGSVSQTSKLPKSE